MLREGGGGGQGKWAMPTSIRNFPFGRGQSLEGREEKTRGLKNHLCKKGKKRWGKCRRPAFSFSPAMPDTLAKEKGERGKEEKKGGKEKVRTTHTRNREVPVVGGKRKGQGGRTLHALSRRRHFLLLGKRPPPCR